MPSVLIVEDHALFRSGLKQLIGIEPGLTVAGEAGDGLAGIRLAQSLRPDLILLDISMPELSGVEAIPRIREVAPGARILIVSMHATAGHVRAALKAGADGPQVGGVGVDGRAVPIDVGGQDRDQRGDEALEQGGLRDGRLQIERQVVYRDDLVHGFEHGAERMVPLRRPAPACPIISSTFAG